MKNKQINQLNSSISSQKSIEILFCYEELSEIEKQESNIKNIRWLVFEREGEEKRDLKFILIHHFPSSQFSKRHSSRQQLQFTSLFLYVYITESLQTADDKKKTRREKRRKKNEGKNRRKYDTRSYYFTLAIID